jgi:hypothetical protein
MTEINVKKLAPPPSVNCIDSLKKYIELAEKGEICSVAITAIGRDGSCYRSSNSDVSNGGALALIGAVRMTQVLLEEDLLRQWGSR